MSAHNRTEEKKGEIKNGIRGAVIAALSLLIQVAVIMYIVIYLQMNYAIVGAFIGLLGFLILLRIYNKPMNSAYKMSWMVLIALLPVFGVCMYILFGNEGINAWMRYKLGNIWDSLRPQLSEIEGAKEALREKNRAIYNQTYYLSESKGYPLYNNTRVTYYGDTKEAFEAQKQALREAKKYIFMEYFAIEDSVAWQEIEEILVDRVRAGVQVRVFYDDAGSIAFINKSFARKLNEKGIECRIFNPVSAAFTILMNNRDHRKITVIDGKVGFTGGYNLADEYFNITHPYGEWKDSAVRLEGEAVKTLVAIFLELWSAGQEKSAILSQYFADDYTIDSKGEELGFVQPYADTPMDDEEIGENVYLNMIKSATEYIYINTPYLILDDEMQREIILAATRGVDVRIVTPGIPDKRLVYGVTRSYYSRLAKAGVKIYEFTPGFLHSKQMVIDDVLAAVGTINFDFRSFYLHFEDGCLFSYCDAVAGVRADCEYVMSRSEEVGAKYAAKKNIFGRLARIILRLFSPML